MVKTLGTPLRNFDTATTSLSSSPKSPPTWLITVAAVTSAVVATASSANGVAVAVATAVVGVLHKVTEMSLPIPLLMFVTILSDCARGYTGVEPARPPATLQGGRGCLKCGSRLPS